ncbi:MAG TPA: hypothetical protein VI036_15780 [Propionibacteriaceae bacterium]|jgi:hypothetical protein
MVATVPSTDTPGVEVEQPPYPTTFMINFRSESMSEQPIERLIMRREILGHRGRAASGGSRLPSLPILLGCGSWRFDQLAPMIIHDPLPDPLHTNLWTPSPFITALVILAPDLDQ